MTEQKPEIIRENGRTIIKNVERLVNFSSGGCTWFSAKLVKTINPYWDYSCTLKCKAGEYSAKEIMANMVFMGSLEDSERFSIEVEGTDEEAEKVALIVYSSYTDRDPYNSGINRFASSDLEGRSEQKP